MRFALNRLAFAAAAAGTLLTACGDSSSSSPATGAATPTAAPTATSTPTATPTATSTPSPSTTPTATPTAPATATAPQLVAFMDTVFPMAQGGFRTTCFQGDTTFAQCPLTPRLRSALEATVNAQTGGGGDPICGCQNTINDYAATGTPDAHGGGVVKVVMFGGSDTLDFVLVASAGSLLVDDIQYCSANPKRSAYPDEQPACT